MNTQNTTNVNTQSTTNVSPYAGLQVAGQPQINHSHSLNNHTHGYTTGGGYNCSRCGQWVSYNLYHNCPGPYYHVVPQVYAPQVTVQPDYLLQAEVAALKAEIAELKTALSEMCELLETMLHLDHNNQDEEVCGNPEEGCESADTGGSTGTSLVKVETPRRRYGWSGA